MPVKLRFQFAVTAGDESRRQLVKELKAKGAREVGPLFVNATDPELALLQVLNSPKGSAEELLQHLRSSECVQFAEAEIRRRIV